MPEITLLEAVIAALGAVFGVVSVWVKKRMTNRTKTLTSDLENEELHRDILNDLRTQVKEVRRELRDSARRERDMLKEISELKLANLELRNDLQQEREARREVERRLDREIRLRQEAEAQVAQLQGT